MLLEVFDWFALLVMCSWPGQASLHPEFIKLVLRDSGIGLEDDTVVILGLTLDIQEDLERQSRNTPSSTILPTLVSIPSQSLGIWVESL